MCYHIRIVYIRKGIACIIGVVIEPVVKLMASNGKPENALAGMQSLFGVCELSCLEHGEISVRAQLSVHSQILKLAVGNKLAEGIWHSADAELNA